jgi:hypothetical protein
VDDQLDISFPSIRQFNSDSIDEKKRLLDNACQSELIGGDALRNMSMDIDLLPAGRCCQRSRNGRQKQSIRRLMCDVGFTVVCFVAALSLPVSLAEAGLSSQAEGALACQPQSTLLSFLCFRSAPEMLMSSSFFLFQAHYDGASGYCVMPSTLP